MGCLSSKNKTPQNDEKKPETKQYSWDKKREELNPADFIISGQKAQTIVKLPGSINGQQFVIEDCSDCDIFLCDYSASVTVDNCTNCRLFVGPVESSIFVRTCRDCKCIIACQQWRTRECENCDIFLYSMTQPIIESSKNLRFGCFQYYYPALQAQFDSAKLNVFVNEWSKMYDFTPSAGNWDFLSSDVGVSNFFKALPTEVSGDSPSSSMVSVVPLTWGNRAKPFSQSCFVVFLNNKPKAVEFCSRVQKESGAVVIQLKEVTLTKEQIKLIFADAPDIHVQLADAVVGIEVNGNDAVSVIQKFVTQFPVSGELAKSIYVSPSLEVAEAQINQFFEQVTIDI